MSALQPIDLADDGLRITRAGSLRGYPMVCLQNPMLIAEVLAIRALRRTISEQNERAFT